MMPSKFVKWIAVVLITMVAVVPVSAAQSDDNSVVRAVLFFSPTCGHCHDVIQNLLLPMIEEKGERLQILGVNSTEEAGSALYQVAVKHYNIPDERRGVPTLIVGETILVGSGEIPSQFPGIVEEGLSGAGIDWPDIPGLQDMLTVPETNSETQNSEGETQSESVGENVVEPESGASETEADVSGASSDDQPQSDASDPVENSLAQAAEAVNEPAPDPVGMALAWILLITMALSLGFAMLRSMAKWPKMFSNGNGFGVLLQSWMVPLLAVVGLGVAGYLAYVEVNQVEAVCGPIGECNLVQASQYAKIAGIPIAVLGLLNYIAIIILWAAQKYTSGQLAKLSAMALLALTGFGVLFSIYLTALEIFVISAVCMWCLSSAAITTALLWLILFSLTDDHRLNGATA